MGTGTGSRQDKATSWLPPLGFLLSLLMKPANAIKSMSRWQRHDVLPLCCNLSCSRSDLKPVKQYWSCLEVTFIALYQ
uniref:Secreted protein n=1 Tax=Mus spicilegus TaxID=10103 RepID=A0A8C6HMY8_MUSSI